jgi:hypothetical protein
VVMRAKIVNFKPRGQSRLSGCAIAPERARCN